MNDGYLNATFCIQDPEFYRIPMEPNGMHLRLMAMNPTPDLWPSSNSMLSAAIMLFANLLLQGLNIYLYHFRFQETPGLSNLA